MLAITHLIITNDVFVTGVEFFDLRPNAEAGVLHPDISDQPVRPLDVVAYFAKHPEKLKGTGLDQPTGCPGVPAGTTKWDMIVWWSKHPDAPAEVQALNLKRLDEFAGSGE